MGRKPSAQVCLCPQEAGLPAPGRPPPLCDLVPWHLADSDAGFDLRPPDRHPFLWAALRTVNARCKGLIISDSRYLMCAVGQAPF